MIECVFTVDYEIYGNGQGSLRDLVYEPTAKLKEIFLKHGARFVVFPDVAELEMIEAHAADPMIGSIKTQLSGLQRDGFELGLHIHPWWYNARRENGTWVLDQTEYNLCTQPKERINEIVDRAVGYLRKLVGTPGFTPLSFRAGHLLFQPTQPLGDVLAEHGIKLDSSVYKGGLWRKHQLDYRRAPKNTYYWKFSNEVTVPDPEGQLLEIPIYTRQAPLWRLLTSKRVGLQHGVGSAKQMREKFVNRISDFMRFRYPHKLDLGQMNKDEMARMIHTIIRENIKRPSTFRPIVAIIHTKDPIDFDAVDSILDILDKNGIKISTLADVHRMIKGRHEGQDGK
jgi:hypothetical protein